MNTHADVIEQQHRNNISELVRRMRIASSMWAIAEAHLENNQFRQARDVIKEAKTFLDVRRT
jgi:hypothetical protein